MAEGERRSEGMRELFNFPKRELPMKTETPPSKLDAFVMMDVIEYAYSTQGVPRGTKPSELQGLLDKSQQKRKRMLSDVYVENHDIRMISKARKGRIEAEKVLTALTREEVDELAI